MYVLGPHTNIGYDSNMFGFILDVDYDANNPAHDSLDPDVPYGLNIIFNRPMSVVDYTNSVEWFNTKQKRENFRAIMVDAMNVTIVGSC